MNEVERRGEIFYAVERVFGSHAAIEMLNEHDAAVRDAERNQLEDALRDARAERDALRARIEALCSMWRATGEAIIAKDAENATAAAFIEAAHQLSEHAALSPAEEQRP